MVTVIITTYKRADLLERAISSVLNQTYKDFELIVVDDNDENTEYRKDVMKKMEKYKDNPKVTYIKHKKNKNGAAARNTGIKSAKGEYIAFLDDDDYFFKDRLKKLVDTLDNNKEYNAAYTASINIRNNNIYEYLHAKKEGNLEYDFLKLNSCLGTGSNLFFRTKALKEINGFDETFIRHQDLEVMVRFFENGNLMKAVDEVLVLKDEVSRINCPNIDKLIDTREKYFKRFETNIARYKEMGQKIYYDSYFELLKFCVRSGDKEKCKMVRKRLEKFGKITYKGKIKLLLLKINRYIKIEGIKDKVKNLKIRKELEPKVINELQEYNIIKQ